MPSDFGALLQQHLADDPKRKSSGSTPTPSAPSADTTYSGGAAGAGIIGAADSATLGAAPYLLGAIAAVDPFGTGAGYQSIWDNPKSRSFGDTVAANVAAIHAKEHRAADEHPYAHFAGEAGGALMIPFGAGAKGAIQVAKVGATQGAIQGFLDSDGSFNERAGEAVKGGAVGGALGGVLGKATEVVAGSRVGKAIGGLLGRKEGGEVIPPEPATQQIVPTPGQPIGGQTLDGRPILQGDLQPSTVAAMAPADRAAMLRDMEKNQQPLLRDETTGDYRDETPEEMAARHSEIDRRYSASQALDRRPSEGGSGGGEPPAGTALESIGEHPDGGPHFTGDREQLDALQGEVEHWMNKIAVDGDRAADPTSSAPDTPGQARFGNLGDKPDVAALLRALSDRFGQPKGTYTDKDLHAFAKAAVDDLAGSGLDADGITAGVKSFLNEGDVTDPTHLANGIAILRTVVAKATSQVAEHSLMGVDWNTATPELVESAATNIRNLTTLASVLSDVGTGMGRGFRTLGLPDSETFTRALQEKLPLYPDAERTAPAVPTTPQQISDWLDNFRTAESAVPGGGLGFAQNNLVVPTPGFYLRTSNANHFTASLLSSPRTVLKNLVGPSIVNIYRAGIRLASPLDPLSWADPQARAVNLATAAEVPKAMLSLLADVGDVFRQVATYSHGLGAGLGSRESAQIASATGRTNTLERGLQAFSANRKLIGGAGQNVDLLSAYGPLTPNLLNLAKDAKGNPVNAEDFRYRLGNLINVFPKAMARLNNGLDEMATRLTYLSEVRLNARVEARLQGLSADETDAYVANALANSEDEAGRAADEARLQMAESSTFTSRPGPEGGIRRRVFDTLTYARQEAPELRALLPIQNVPANVLGFTLANTGIARFAGSWLDTKLGGGLERLFQTEAESLKGNLGPVAQAEAHGRWLLASAVMTGAATMNKLGLLTGAGPQDPTDRKVWLSQGMQPYSIRIGGEWVRYDAVDVLGGILSIPATIHDATTNRPQDEATTDMILSGAGAMAQWLKDQAALQQVGALFGMGGDPTSSVANVASKLGGNVAAGMLVPRAVGTVVTNPVDPISRLKDHWYDYVTAAIPGLSKELPPVRNIFGEAVNKANDSLAEGVFPITMASVNPHGEDKVMEEMYRLYTATGYGAGTDPSGIGSGHFDPKGVTLEDGRPIMDHLLAARQVTEINGMTLREALAKLVSSRQYQQAVDGQDPGVAHTSLGQANRTYMVAHTFSEYNKAIKAKLVNSSPIAAAYLTAAAAKEKDSAALGGYTADDLVKNPNLYAIHGIRRQQYTRKLQQGGTRGLLTALGD